MCVCVCLFVCVCVCVLFVCVCVVCAVTHVRTHPPQDYPIESLARDLRGGGGDGPRESREEDEIDGGGGGSGDEEEPPTSRAGFAGAAPHPSVPPLTPAGDAVCVRMASLQVRASVVCVA